jgi:hypothetical protein
MVKLTADVRDINGSLVVNVAEDYLQEIRDKYLVKLSKVLNFR